MVPESYQWLKSELESESPLGIAKFATKLLDILSEMNNKALPIDAEILYLAFKAGVFTGRLNQIVAFNWDNNMHPGVRAYQGMAWLLMNNFCQSRRVSKPS